MRTSLLLTQLWLERQMDKWAPRSPPAAEPTTCVPMCQPVSQQDARVAAVTCEREADAGQGRYTSVIGVGPAVPR